MIWEYRRSHDSRDLVLEELVSSSLLPSLGGVSVNRLAYHLWSLSRDENLLRAACCVCIALAGLFYLAAGIGLVPDIPRYHEQNVAFY
jgi:hypothetical protein